MSAKFKDFKFTSQELVLAMVNAANSLRLDLNRVEFVDPVPTTGSHNTQATMRAKAGGGFEGSFPIKYNRLDFNVLFSAYPVILDPDNYDTSDQLLPIINEGYGLKLEASDIVVESVNIVNDKYVLKANSQSIAWFGQTDVVFRVDITAVSNFPVTSLNGVFMPAYIPFEFTFTVDPTAIGTVDYSAPGHEYVGKLGSKYYWDEISQHMPGQAFSYVRVTKDALVDGVKRDILVLILPTEIWTSPPKFVEVNGVRSVKAMGGKGEYAYAFEQLPTPIEGLAYQISISNEYLDESQLPCQTFRKHVNFSINDMAGTTKALSNLKDVGQSYPAGTVGLNLSTNAANAWMIGDYIDTSHTFNALDTLNYIERIYWQDEVDNSIRVAFEVKDLSWENIASRQFPARIKYGNAISKLGVVEFFQYENGQNWRNAIIQIRYEIVGSKPTAGTEGLIEFLEEFLTVTR